MAKIDLYSGVMNRRAELAAKIAGQLKTSLNTVVPVSAGLRRALDRLLEDNGAGLRRLMEAMRRIPPADGFYHHRSCGSRPRIRY